MIKPIIVEMEGAALPAAPAPAAPIPAHHEAAARLRAWGGMGAAGYSRQVCADLCGWLEAGAQGPLPAMPSECAAPDARVAARKLPDVSDLLTMAVEAELIPMRLVMNTDIQDALEAYTRAVLAATAPAAPAVPELPAGWGIEWASNDEIEVRSPGYSTFVIGSHAGSLYGGALYRLCEALLDAGAAAAPAVPVPQWQPIETAPKDGTLFLCWVSAVRYGETDEGQQYEQDVSQVDFCNWRTQADIPDCGWFDPCCGQIGDSQGVTHWMPLPDAPADITQQPGGEG